MKGRKREGKETELVQTAILCKWFGKTPQELEESMSWEEMQIYAIVVGQIMQENPLM